MRGWPRRSETESCRFLVIASGMMNGKLHRHKPKRVECFFFSFPAKKYKTSCTCNHRLDITLVRLCFDYSMSFVRISLVTWRKKTIESSSQSITAQREFISYYFFFSLCLNSFRRITKKNSARRRSEISNLEI